jgi:hypothetical protein
MAAVLGVLDPHGQGLQIGCQPQAAMLPHRTN